MLTILLSLFLALSPTSVTAADIQLPIQESLQPNFDQMLYLANIANCESDLQTNIKVLDTNHKYSYGALQFQLGTFLHQSEVYGLEYTKKDIYDIKKQFMLAHRMLLDGGEFHWKNCTKGTKYPK